MYRDNVEALNLQIQSLQTSLWAEHVIAEGTAAWVHLADYGRGKGRDMLLNSNVLATAVREELIEVIKRLPA